MPTGLHLVKMVVGSPTVTKLKEKENLMPKKPLDYFKMSYITKKRKRKSRSYNSNNNKNDEQEPHRSHLNHKSRESNTLAKDFIV